MTGRAPAVRFLHLHWFWDWDWSDAPARSLTARLSYVRSGTRVTAFSGWVGGLNVKVPGCGWADSVGEGILMWRIGCA